MSYSHIMQMVTKSSPKFRPAICKNDPWSWNGSEYVINFLVYCVNGGILQRLDNLVIVMGLLLGGLVLKYLP